MMTAEVKSVLDEIPELAWVSIDAAGVRYIHPRLHLREYYARPILRFLKQYATIRAFEGEYFLCLYDGWREYSKPFADPHFVPWKSVDQSRFRGRGAAGEPRFVHRDSNGVFPTLPLPILAFCRHQGDSNTLLIPDPHFLGGDLETFLKQVRIGDVDWHRKSGTSLFWRGAKHVSHYAGQVEPHHRELLTSSSEPILDARYSSNVPIASQLQNKFLIDADGYVSAWTGLFWKLYSNSVPIKLPSHWEQWYYSHLRDRENMVSMDSDIWSTYSWLTTNDEVAREIATAGKRLAEMLTYRYALEEYVIA